NCSIIGSAGNGFLAVQDTLEVGDGVYSFFSDNALILNNTGVPWNVSSQSNWLIDYPRIYGNSGSPSPGLTDSHVTNETTTDPTMGSCLIWIPDGSNLKGTGKGGADVGANVLYAYVNGTLTGTKLWNTSTNKFAFQGAIVSGVNDTAGDSLDNVPARLHVGLANGCAFPSSYNPRVSGQSTRIDFDDDAKSDIAVYRDGTWFIIRSSDGGVTETNWGGAPQDILVPGDYDGDGKTDQAVYRDGVWWILRSSNGGGMVRKLGSGRQGSGLV